MKRVWALVRLGRPHFLASGFLLYGIGVLLALGAGAAWDLAAYAWGQAFVTATQWMVHYQNDYHDRAGDALATHASPWSGGSRVLPGGEVPPEWARVAAWLLAFVAAVCAVGALWYGGADGRAFAIMAATWLLAAAYSTPPWRLQARGVGPLVTTGILVGLVPVLGYRLHGGEAWAPLLVLLPLALLLLAALLVIDIPDEVADRAVGKRTPVVRWGPAACAALAIILVPAAFVLAAALWWPAADRSVASASAVAFAAAAPWGVWALLSLARRDWRRRAAWAWMEFRMLGLFMVASAGLVVSLTVAVLRAP